VQPENIKITAAAEHRTVALSFLNINYSFQYIPITGLSFTNQLKLIILSSLKGEKLNWKLNSGIWEQSLILPAKYRSGGAGSRNEETTSEKSIPYLTNLLIKNIFQ
jgi:hypothetical protein